MEDTQLDFSQIVVRLAQSPAEIEQAQRVRFQVFYEENGAKPTEEMSKKGLDFDVYDEFADHLVVVDESNGQNKIIGTYRLLTQDAAEKAGGFYSADEFDISLLLDSGLSLLELGRSCVLPQARSKPVLQKLWQGIADYITERKIDLMFGCASFHGTDPKEFSEALSYMHHYHLGEEGRRPRALSSRYVDMNILPKEELNEKRVFASLPPILKGYFRVGGYIGQGAVIDEQFNTIDVLIMVETQSLTQRYRNHYERKLQKSMTDKAAAG